MLTLRSRRWPAWLLFLSPLAAGVLACCGLLLAAAGRDLLANETGPIAFTSNCDGNPDLYMMNVDGAGLVRLTNHPADDYEPDWGP